MEKLIELIEKYLLYNINEEILESRLNKLYRKSEFEYEMLEKAISYINDRPKNSNQKIRSKNRLIEILIIYYIGEHIVDMSFERICDMLNDLNVDLSRSLIIQLINKNIINKNNLDKASKIDGIINVYYLILKEDIKIDYNYLMKELADLDIHNYDPKKLLNEKNELALLKDYKKVDADLKIALKKLNKSKNVDPIIENINILLAKKEQISTCLLKYNYGLVHDILRQTKVVYYTNMYDYDFYFNEGLMGLTEAINRYNLLSGIRLSSFAYYYIKLYINRAATNERLVKLPTDVLESRKAIARYNEEDLQKFLNAKNQFISLDAKVDDSSDSEELYNLDLLADSLDDNYKRYTKDVANEAVENYNREKLLKILKDNLSESRYNIIYDYFYNDLKKSEIAEKNNYSGENADQKINRALNQIKKIQGIQDIAQYGYGFNIPEKIKPVSEGEEDMDIIKEIPTKESHFEHRIDDFSVTDNARDSLLRKFCGCFRVEYKKNPIDTKDSVAYEYINKYLNDNNKNTFEKDIYDNYGSNISTFSGYPFIKQSDIEKEIDKINSKLPDNARTTDAYMGIDDVFYLKIANKIREEHRNGSKETLNRAKSYENSNIYYHVRFLANYYLVKYYFGPRGITVFPEGEFLPNEGTIASDTVIKDLLELVLVSYNGVTPMTSHLKEVIKYTIEQAVMVYNKIGDDLEYTIEEEIAMLLNNEYEVVWGKIKSLS